MPTLLRLRCHWLIIFVYFADAAFFRHYFFSSDYWLRHWLFIDWLSLRRLLLHFFIFYAAFFASSIIFFHIRFIYFSPYTFLRDAAALFRCRAHFDASPLIFRRLSLMIIYYYLSLATIIYSFIYLRLFSPLYFSDLLIRPHYAFSPFSSRHAAASDCFSRQRQSWCVILLYCDLLLPRASYTPRQIHYAIIFHSAAWFRLIIDDYIKITIIDIFFICHYAILLLALS